MSNTSAKLTHDFYRGDPEAASRFTNAYLESGNVTAAYEAAGQPKNGQRPQLVWLTQGEGSAKREVLHSVREASRRLSPSRARVGLPLRQPHLRRLRLVSGMRSAEKALVLVMLAACPRFVAAPIYARPAPHQPPPILQRAIHAERAEAAQKARRPCARAF